MRSFCLVQITAGAGISEIIKTNRTTRGSRNDMLDMHRPAGDAFGTLAVLTPKASPLGDLLTQHTRNMGHWLCKCGLYEIIGEGVALLEQIKRLRFS